MEHTVGNVYTNSLTAMFNALELYVGQRWGLLRMMTARLVVAVAYSNAGLSGTK